MWVQDGVVLFGCYVSWSVWWHLRKRNRGDGWGCRDRSLGLDFHSGRVDECGGQFGRLLVHF